MLAGAHLSSRWITEFEKQIVRGKHVLLYGNVDDQFLWRGEYLTAHAFLQSWFVDRGFDLVARYDAVDGFVFAAPEMAPRFEAIWSAPVAAAMGQPSAPPAGDGRAARRSPLQAAGTPAGTAVVPVLPDHAIPRIRTVLSQPETSAAVILDLADMLTAHADHYGEEERNRVMRLKKCTLGATFIGQGPIAGLRNTLVLTAGELGRVPEWFYRENPFVSLVQAARPGREERRQFALAFTRPTAGHPGFFGGGQAGAPAAPDDAVIALAEAFSDLTEGFQAWDLEALRRTSHVERIPVTEVRRLVDFFKFGLRDDPWRELNRDRIAGARERLSHDVIGQPAAVEAVTSMLTSARVGITMSPIGPQGGRPRGVFFFVGPTGVGKTELAKALTKLVFGDEKAFERFDMSEYKEEHAAEKLAGAPPGFVGYEEGGRLTNRVIERPHSILLFDEIEKAHPRVLDKFLQILEDGRLTDGKGQTAYFNQTAIIFTSNIGASDLTDPQTGQVIRSGIMRRVTLENVSEFPYADAERHFRDEVSWYFASRIGRAELLNRLGDSIVVFDLLRPQHVEGIGRKFLALLCASAREKAGVTLRCGPTILERLRTRMAEGDNLLYGGRRVKTLLEAMVERPLNRWIFDQGDGACPPGTTLELSVDADGALEVRRV
jgi:hypothetical protein